MNPGGQKVHPHLNRKTLAIGAGALLLVIFLFFQFRPPVSAPPTTLTPTPSGTPTAAPPPISLDSAPSLALVSSFGVGAALEAAWSPDGRTLAIATTLGIDLYETAHFTPTARLAAGQGFLSIAYSPDGAWLAAGKENGDVLLWNAAGQLQHVLPGSAEPAARLAFSPDSRVLFSGEQDSGIVRQWDAASGALTATYNGEAAELTALAASANGQYLLAASPTRLYVFSPASQELLYTVDTPTNAAFFTPYGTQIITLEYGYRYGAILKYESHLRVWDAAGGQLVKEQTAALDAVYAAAINAPQGHIAVAGLNGVNLYAGGAIVVRPALQHHTGGVRALAFSPDGSRLVFVGLSKAGGTGAVEVWDTAERAYLQTVGEYGGGAWEGVLNAEGQYTALALYGGRVQLREAASGALVHEFVGAAPLSFSRGGRLIAFAAAVNTTLGSNSARNLVEIWDVASGQRLPKGLASCPGVTALAFSPDGVTLAYGGEHCRVTLRDMAAGEATLTLNQAQFDQPRNTYYVESLAFSPDGTTLAVLGRGVVELWDAAGGELLLTLQDAPAAGRLAYSPDGRFLAAGGAGSDLRIWRVSEPWPAMLLPTGFGAIARLAYSPDGQALFVGGDLAAVEIWDAATGRLASQLPISAAGLVGLSFSADGRSLLTAGENGALQLWRAAAQAAPTSSGTARATPTWRPSPTPLPTSTPTLAPVVLDMPQIITLGSGVLNQYQRSPNGRVIAATVDRSILRWYDAQTYAELGSLSLGGSTYLTDMAFSPDSRLLVADGGADGPYIINLAEQTVIREMDLWADWVSDFAFTPDNHYLLYMASDWSDRAIGLFDIESGREMDDDHFQLPGFGASPSSNPALSPDGRRVAAGIGNRVYIWNLATGETLLRLSGHVDYINSVAYSPDGRYLASGSADGTVRLWYAASGALARRITGLVDNVNSVRFSANGQALVIAMSGHPDQVYDLGSGQLRAAPSPTPDPFALHLHRQGYLDAASNAGAILFSPDGRRLAVSSSNILLWDTTAPQAPPASLESQTGAVVNALAFSADGALLAAASRDGLVQAWEIASGALLLTAQDAAYASSTNYGSCGGLAFSPAGARLALANGSAIEVWDAPAGRLALALQAADPPAHACRLSYSSDGRRLYAVLDTGSTAAWDALSGRLLYQMALPYLDTAYGAEDMALHGSLFAYNTHAAESGYGLELWNLDTQQQLPLEASNRICGSLAFSAGSRLLAGNCGAMLYFWRVDTGQLVYHTAAPLADGLAFSPDGRLLALSFAPYDVGLPGRAQLWDTRAIASRAASAAMTSAPLLPTATPRDEYAYTPEPTRTPTPNPTRLAPLPTPALPDGAISAANAGSLRQVFHFGHGIVEQVAWAADGRGFLTAGALGAYRYALSGAAGLLTETARLEPGAWVYDVVALPNGQALAAGTAGDRLLAWDVASGAILADLPGSGAPVISPDGRLLALRAGGSAWQVWQLGEDAAAPALLADVYAYSDNTARPVFSPDSRLLAAALHDTVRVWDAHSGQIVNALGGPAAAINDLAFSADGRYLAGAAGGSAWVWDVRADAQPYSYTIYTGERDNNLLGDVHTVTAVALSPDGRLLAAGTAQNTIWLIDRASRAAAGVLAGHTGPVQRLRFSPDGARLLSNDADGGVLIWDVAGQKRLNALYTHTGAISGLRFRPDGRLAAWRGGTLWQLDGQDGSLLGATRIYSGTILALSPLRGVLAVHIPYHVVLLNGQNGALLQTLEDEAAETWVYSGNSYYGSPARGFYAASFSPDDLRLTVRAAGGAWQYALQNDGRYKKISFKEESPELVSPDMVEISTLSPDRRWLGHLSSSLYYDYIENTFSLLDANSNLTRHTFAPRAGVYLVNFAFSPDSSLVAVSDSLGHIYLFDVASFNLLATLSAPAGSAAHLAFSPDGRFLVTGGEDGVIRFWGAP